MSVKIRACLLLLAALCSAATVNAAENLLQNGNFNGNLAGSWTGWTYGGGWNGGSTTPTEAYDGSQFIYMGGSEGGAGFYQEVFAVANVPYTISAVSSVQAWWWPEAQMRLIFLGATGNELLMVQTNCAASITANDTGLAWAPYELTAVSPVGTKKVKVEFACFGHGTVRFENAVLTAPLVYPTLQNLAPDGSTLMQKSATFSFTAASTVNPIDDASIKVTVNGADVSSSLAISGASMSRNIVYSGITSNRTYDVSIQVADTSGLIVARSLTFDTFDTSYYTFEAEDYDYNGGSYIENPQTNAYFGLAGVLDVDYHAAINDNMQVQYRPGDVVGTEANADAKRPQYAAASDYSVGWFDANEWLNYTRTLPAGLFNVYARMSSPGSSTLNLSRVTAGVGTTTQTTASIGTFNLQNGRGWGTYSWVPLKDANGNMVKFSSAGLQTLRATSGGNGNFQFVMFAPADTNVPSITDIYPNGTTMFQATNTFRFSANSAGGINPDSISVSLSVTNLTWNYTTNLTVANGLTVGGTPNNRTVSYAGLVTNASYTAVITVTDAYNNTVTISPRFDTFVPVMTWEAEDYDYEGGKFFAAPGINNYVGLVGFEGIDYHEVNSSGAHSYRSTDLPTTEANGDAARAGYLALGTNDYSVGYFVTAEWMNHTRNFPAGTYNVYARMASTGGTGVQALSVVTNGVGTTAQESKRLGVFNYSSTGGWGTYQFFPLRDEFGNIAAVTLGGQATLKVQKVSGVDANINFYMLVPANNTLPRITDVTPIGWMNSTNRLTFKATSPAGIPAENVVVRLNNVTVTNATLTGTANSWNGSVVLAPNTVYSAVITVTDINNVSTTSTFSFETFNPNAYVWEAEDFDYDSGLFYDNPQVNAYFNLGGTEGVDFHNSNTGDLNYRNCPIGTQKAGDLVRIPYDGVTYIDYNLSHTASGEWQNYTRTFPAGAFNVYLRAARGSTGNGVMGLQQVTAGAGTANQTTAPLGTFTVPGVNNAWQTYKWVPLMDATGNLAVVKLNGKATLRLTDGGANANFFMLTPALNLQAVVSGTSMNLSFGTQAGFNYSVLYTDNLGSGVWTELSSVAGDGTVKTVNAAMAGSGRFYRLQVR